MKLDDYEISEALRARDWRAAVNCLARHFNIVDRLPPLDYIGVREYSAPGIVQCVSFYRGRCRTAWHWDGVVGFVIETLGRYSDNTRVIITYCDELANET